MILENYDEAMKKLNERNKNEYAILFGCTGDNKVVNSPKETIQKLSKYENIEKSYNDMKREVSGNSIPYVNVSLDASICLVAVKKFSYNSVRYDDIIRGIELAIKYRSVSYAPTNLSLDSKVFPKFYIVLPTFYEKNLVYKELIKKIEKLERKVGMVKFIGLEV